MSRDSGTKKFFGAIAAILLIATVLLAGCTGTQAPPPTPPPTFQPGQTLQLIGSVTGQGVMPSGIPRGTIDTITFTIGLVPSVKSINLANLSIIYSDALTMVTLTPVPGLRGIPPKGSWGIIGINRELGKANDRLDYEEQAVISINPKAAVVPGQVVTIVVKPIEGPAITIRRVAPATILQGDNMLQPL